jgi:predicted Zn finger-like uncharacterized protein
VIVTCERCATQFQLDDAKVPEGGVRVRCSRCDHAFSIESPERSDADRGEDLAREALGEDPLGEDPLGEDPEGATEAESDWGFNDDLPISKTAEPSAPVGITVSEAQDAASAAVDDLLDFGDSSEREPDDSFAAETPESVAAAAVSSNGESGDPFDRSDGPQALEALQPAADSLDLDLADDVADRETADETDAEIDFEAATGAEIGVAAEAADAAGAAEAEAEGLGDPEEWNFFDEPGSTAYSEIPSAAAAQTVVESSAVRSEPQVGLPMPTETVEENTPLWRTRLGQGVGWAIVTALCLFGVVRGLTPVDSIAAGSGVWAGGGFEAQAVRGRWLDTVSGRVYVISGEIRRATPQALAAPLPQIRLLDRAGELLTVAPVPLGPELAESWLREMPAARLVAARKASASPFARRVQSWEPFLAVVTDVPDSANRFAFDVIP